MASPSQGLPPRREDEPRRTLRRALFGAPRDLSDPGVFHTISLVAFLAWVGLGADGLSSSAYGPDEAYRHLEGQNYLAVFLALVTAITVFIISSNYNRVIEHFPYGGGGYLVATKLLGQQAGVVAGASLLVDYVLTITVSVASGGDAIFNFMPLSIRHNHDLKIGLEVMMMGVLILLNLRGVKESVQALMPIFLVFVVTHLVLILGGIAAHADRIPAVARSVSTGLDQGVATYGKWGLFLVFVRAYSLGGGTYTGIEAVSNGLQIMREPRIQTGKRTMTYMAFSLAFTAGGILLCYLLYDVHPVRGQTLNGVLAEAFAGHWVIAGIPVGHAFVILTLLSEAALLFVAAQTGFIGGPRMMANMAVDSWLPHRFASLSDRLTSKDGVLLMGAAAIAILIFTGGSVDALVVMYSINVFATFTLTNAGMIRFFIGGRDRLKGWLRALAVHIVGLVLCASILVITVVEKFSHGAWLTIVITTITIAACVWVRAHYRGVALHLRRLDQDFLQLPTSDHHGGVPDPKKPTAVLLVGQFGGVGIHSLLSIHKMIPNYFKNVIFVSVAVIDSGTFKGAEDVEALKRGVDDALAKYVDLARRLGWNADSATSAGTDPVDEITRVCLGLSRTYPQVMFFAGKLIWKRESWWQRILHNETAFQVQRRLQWKGLPMTVIPLRAHI
ncbi:MAG: APC family permease [Myxococcales bacterium]|nr:APC family permease [Myxococcales bacterium]